MITGELVPMTGGQLAPSGISNEQRDHIREKWLHEGCSYKTQSSTTVVTARTSKTPMARTYEIHGRPVTRAAETVRTGYRGPGESER
jgi:hypothetical protein